MGSIFDTELPEEKFGEDYDPNAGVGGFIPKGKYEALVRFASDEVPPEEQWEATGENPTNYYTQLTAEVLTNGQTGRRVWGMFSTMPTIGKKEGPKTSSAAQALNGLKGKGAAAEQATPVDLARALTTAIGPEVKARISVDRETLPCRECKARGVKWTKDAPTGYRGEASFPTVDGVVADEVTCPQCDAELKIQNTFRILKGLQ